jgi:hypothetical protein
MVVGISDKHLKRRLKKRGMRRPSFRLDGVVPPKLDEPPVGRGKAICGFIVSWTC